MFNSLFYLLFLLLLFFGGYETTVSMPLDPARPIGVPTSAPFSLNPGDSAAIGDPGLLVTFDAIAGDNRCPQWQECAESGPVSVALSVREPGSDPTQLILSAHTDKLGRVQPGTAGVVVSATVRGHSITLLEVKPYPQAGEETQANKFTVQLRVDPQSSDASNQPTDAPLPPPMTPTVIQAALDEPFELRLGDTAVLSAEDLQVQFTAVRMDSRCPLDVQCAWSGVVGLEFAAKGPDGTLQTATLGGYAGQDGEVRPAMETGTAPHMWLAGYTIAIQRVVPYPAHHDQRIAPEEYVATLVVTREEVDAFPDLTAFTHAFHHFAVVAIRNQVRSAIQPAPE